jgi:hypothetical protein
MQTTGTVLLAAEQCSIVRLRTPAPDSRSAHGCCTSLLHGAASARRNTVKRQLTLTRQPTDSRLAATAASCVDHEASWSAVRPCPRLAHDIGADVVRPLRFATAAGSLLSLDRLPAGFADLPGGVGEVIFPRMLVAAGVGIRTPSALARDIAQVSRPGFRRVCISDHLHSSARLPGPGTESQRGVTSSMAWGSATS